MARFPRQRTSPAGARAAAMIWQILAVVFGLGLLVLSADCFVDGAAALARIAGMSPLLIGMLVIAFGTSAPELMVSATSAMQGNGGIALGNAYGSNIANIGLILGVSALLRPLPMQRRLVFGELSVLVVVTLCCFFWLHDAVLSRGDGIAMLVLFTCLIALALFFSRRDKRRGDPEASANLPRESLSKAGGLTLLGLIFLIVSANGIVWGAVGIARGFGVSDLVVGLTVIAIGTSLPELASTLSAVRKNRTDMAFGNAIGSNLFNTLPVVGLSAVIEPFQVDRIVLERDLPVMTAFTVFLFLLGLRRLGRSTELGPLQGLILSGGFFAYTAYLITTRF